MKNTGPKIDAAGWWYELDQRAKIGLAVGLGVLVIVLCIAAILVARMAFAPSPPEPTTTATSLLATPVPTVPVATQPPEPTDTPLPPTDVPMPTDTPMPTDAQGDVAAYASGEPVADAPPGIDIRAASVDIDMGVVLQPTEGVPEDLAGWAEEGDVLLWITLHEPIPDPPTSYTEWLFALDLDGNAETGRPEGSKGRIDPDFGMDVAIAVYYDPATEQYGTYCLVWDAEGGSWKTGPQVRSTLSDSRTLVGMAVSLDELAEAAGVTIAPDAVKGRAAALVGKGDERVIDFYPDLPE